MVRKSRQCENYTASNYKEIENFLRQKFYTSNTLDQSRRVEEIQEWFELPGVFFKNESMAEMVLKNMLCFYAKNPYPASELPRNSWLSVPAIFSKMLGRSVLPALTLGLEGSQKDTMEIIAKNNFVDIKNGTVVTHDEAILDTIEITPQSVKMQPISESRYLVKFRGNRGFYENWLEDDIKDANRYNARVIGFNYRGVGNSQKAPEGFHELVTDGIAQVQRLIDAGANSENILLDGESLGGAIATMVAHYFHSKNMPVYIWNSRSFFKLSTTAINMAVPNLPEKVKTILGFLIMGMGWEVDVASAYQKINPDYKAYMVIAKETEKHKGDTVIPYSCSLHEAVRKNEEKCKKLTGHEVLANGIFKGHTDKRENLTSIQNNQLNGQNLFDNFVRQAGMKS